MQRLGMSDAELAERFGDALVVAVDDSQTAAAALRFAARLAHRSGSVLHVLMVWNLVIGPAPEPSPERPPSEQDWQRKADAVLAAFVSRVLAGSDRPSLQLHAVHANVDPMLEDVSRVAEHLVVGTRGRGGVRSLLLGSSSGRLVNHAHCPVTVVPPDRG